jgi:hypothetical protein
VLLGIAEAVDGGQRRPSPLVVAAGGSQAFALSPGWAQGIAEDVQSSALPALARGGMAASLDGRDEVSQARSAPGLGWRSFGEPDVADDLK